MAFLLGKGHWASGSSDVRIDGKFLKGDARRATGALPEAHFLEHILMAVESDKAT